MKKGILVFTFFLFILLPVSYVEAAPAAAVLDFNVNPSYDLSARSEVSAVLIKTSSKLYFYVEQGWWNGLNNFRQSEVRNAMNILAIQFENTIKPTLNEVFGDEWNPGVDGDSHITILVHQMQEGVGAYIRTTDEFLTLQLPSSNEREMVYMSSHHIETSLAKSFLAHEFVHLITFNQKDRIRGVVEDVWLNEARAEYAPTLLGYNKQYPGSNLELRVEDFLKEPTDSLVEWLNQEQDYAVISLFTHYLVDHYSVEILIDSLNSDKVGIAAINEALLTGGFSETFEDIFTNWTIALFLNDCSFGERYCYLNQNLADLRLSPSVNFLPLSGESSLSVTHVTKNWSGNWQKFIGGRGEFTLKFSSLKGLYFKVPYLLQTMTGDYVLDILPLGDKQTGTISIPEFGKEYKALIIIPSLQSKTSGFNGFESTFPFSFTTSLLNSEQNEEQALIIELLERIALLQSEIARLRAQLVGVQSGSTSAACAGFQQDLFFGITNSQEVKCLQQVLTSEGGEVYPSGLVTGNFLSLTRDGVIKLQEKYLAEILAPIGLEQGTGFVGSLTRKKLNAILGVSSLLTIQGK